MRLNKFILMFFSLSIFVGCAKEEDIISTDTQVGHSRVTFFPTFTMKGAKYSSIVKGGAFTDPGVTAKEGTADLTVTTSGTVDVNTVGVYDITYSAVNKDGFAGSTTRTVAVLPSDEQAGVNIAGSYANTGSFVFVATITKLAPGFYLANNIWGMGSAAVIPSYILTVDGTNWILPVNELSGYGRVSGTATLDAAGNLTYLANLLDFGLNNSTRKWKKQ